jgi:hypothetical protein
MLAKVASKDTETIINALIEQPVPRSRLRWYICYSDYDLSYSGRVRPISGES